MTTLRIRQKKTLQTASSCVLALTLASCSESASPPAEDAAVVPDVIVAPSSSFASAIAPVCPGSATGSATVWLDHPDDLALVSRPLHCLDGKGTLSGPFIGVIKPDGWTAAAAADLKFDYPFDDARLQEVQSYYIVVGMVGHLQAATLSAGVIERIPPISIELHTAEHMATSHYWFAPRRIDVGLDSIRPALVSAQILGHEYAHHLILLHAEKHDSQIDQVVNEALADYFVADYTGETLVVSLRRLTLPKSIYSDATLMKQARKHFERSVDNDFHLPGDQVTKRQLCDFMLAVDDRLEPPDELVPAERLAKCGQMSDQELDAIEPHLTGRIIAGALWRLRDRVTAAKLNPLLLRALADGAGRKYTEFPALLLAADVEHNDAAHEDAIRELFSARGFDL